MNVTDGEIIQLGALAYTPSGGAEVDLTTFTQDATLEITRRELDATRMGHTAMARKKGLREWKVSGTFLQNYGSSSVVDLDAVLYTELNADTAAGAIRTRVFSGSRGLNNPEYAGPATLFSHRPFGGKTGDLLVTPFEFRSAGNLTRTASSS